MKYLPKDMLKWVAAAFALVATATAEYELARAIGMHPWVAAAVPGALDAYVVRALRAHREVLTAVLAMVAVNAASHLVSAGVLQVEWPLITAVSAIAPLVLWRVHALGTSSTAAEHTSTDRVHVEHTGLGPCPECEHGREHGVLPSTEAEHTSTATCPMCGWGCPPDVLGKHIRETCPKRFEHTNTMIEHGENAAKVKALFEIPERRGCVWEHEECEGWNACTVYHPEHATELTGTRSTEQEHVRAQTAAWGDDWLDVHDAVSTPPAAPKGPAGPKGPVGTESSTPPVPVHAPYKDHVHVEHTSTPTLRLVKHTGTEPEHTSTEAEHTRTADDWNLEHVSTGVLEPDDVEHMDRARELFHTIQGLPPFRALKEGTPGMGTARARRLRAALEVEHAASTPSTDGART